MHPSPSTQMTLDQLPSGSECVLHSFKTSDQWLRSSDRDLILRMEDLGFIPGSVLKIRHRGLIGGEPLAIEIRGAILAIGRYEASLIIVDPSSESFKHA